LINEKARAVPDYRNAVLKVVFIKCRIVVAAGTLLEATQRGEAVACCSRYSP